MKKVSICIPAYNNVQGIKRLVDSIAIQNFRDFEVIITDDSVNDEIAELVCLYPDLDIQYYKNEERLGAIANWNSAIGKATGEYIKIMHHDDWFTDEASLETFVQMLDNNPDTVLAFCGTHQVGDNISYSRHISEEDAALIREDYRNLYLGNTIGAPSAVIHRRNSYLYDQELTWLVDMDFYMQLLKDKNDFVYTEKPLISIGMGEEQLTQKCISNKTINCFEYKYIYKKYNLEPVPAYRDKLVKVLIRHGCSVREMRETGIPVAYYRRKQAVNFAGKVKTKIKIIMNKIIGVPKK